VLLTYDGFVSEAADVDARHLCALQRNWWCRGIGVVEKEAKVKTKAKVKVNVTVKMDGVGPRRGAKTDNRKGESHEERGE
jgi:hypothetical protein